jgi:hypothetical protein
VVIPFVVAMLVLIVPIALTMIPLNESLKKPFGLAF